MIVSEIKLYELLKAKIGQGEAEALIRLIETKVGTKLNDTLNLAKEDLVKTLDELFSTISQSKVDIIKWMIATAIAIVGLTVALIKLG